LRRARHRRKLITPRRIAIGCSRCLLGEGIKKLLEDEEGIEVTGIFNNGLDSKEIIERKPDIVILDFEIFNDLPEGMADDTKMKILLMGGSGLNSIPDRQIVKLISKGAVGILPAGVDSSLLKRAIKAVSSGELWLDRKTLSDIIFYNSHLENGQVSLTKSEKEIVFLICKGFKNKEIAENLKVSEDTVKSHCNRIYKKVGVADRLQLAIYVYKFWPDWYTEEI